MRQSVEPVRKKPIMRGLLACCARAASGQAAAAPPRRVMNARRLMGTDPKTQDHGLSIAGVRPGQWRASQQKAAPHVRIGSMLLKKDFEGGLRAILIQDERRMRN